MGANMKQSHTGNEHLKTLVIFGQLLLVASLVSLVLGSFAVKTSLDEAKFFKSVGESFIQDPLPDELGLEKSPELPLLRIMNMVHTVLLQRKAILHDKARLEPNNLFRLVSDEFNDAHGACGGFTNVLGRILLEQGYQVRKLGIDKPNQTSIHIILEVKIDQQWFLMDPYYNLVYRDQAGKLAAAKDLSQNWDFFSQQTPVHYPSKYNFQIYHYTNWQKLGGFGTLIERIVDGGSLDAPLSIFKYQLRKERYIAYVLILFGLFGLAIFAAIKVKTKSRMRLNPASDAFMHGSNDNSKTTET